MSLYPTSLSALTYDLATGGLPLSPAEQRACDALDDLAGACGQIQRKIEAALAMTIAAQQRAEDEGDRLDWLLLALTDALAAARDAEPRT